MKKIIIVISGLLLAIASPAQVNKRDTVRMDTAYIEKIKKVPMDTAPAKMPVQPLPPPNDSKNPKKKQPVHTDARKE